ncbi:PilW family protein [Aeoliella mucimassa]|uniref:Uncharacterized protein n=1 Tax=Aeoliella mucimassa TaxID=2527972 RepID=A0A518ARU2_9BACT|nr:hypothetical protein [Aeoliella mucimassa]QDU57436.1 hypothetical protein Pan181_36520 [Aeoliella mucimassa]
MFRRRPAHTLMELVVATTSATLLLAGMGSSVYVASQSLDLAQDGSVTNSQATLALDQMVRDLEHAQRFSERTDKAITFTVPDRDSDRFDEVIRYAWSGTPGDPLTYELNHASGGMLIESVENLDFTYLTRTISAREINLSEDSPKLLYVVQDSSSPSSNESSYKSAFGDWGYRVELISQGASSTTYATALEDAAVVFVSGEVSNGSYVGWMLANHGGGVVSACEYTASTLGITDAGYFPFSTTIRMDDTTHPITESFSSGNIAIVTSSLQIFALASPIAPGAELPASALYSGSYYPCFPIIEVGSQLTTGQSAVGRRIQLPCSDSRMRLTDLTSEGLVMWQKSVAWAAELGDPNTPRVRFRGYGDSLAETDATSLNLPVPTGHATGDLLIAVVATDGQTSFQNVNGWTVLVSQSNDTAQCTLGIWYRIASSTEPATYSFQWDQSEQAYGWMMRFDGHDAVAPIHAMTTTSGTSTSPTSPSLATNEENCMVVRIVGLNSNAINTTAPGVSGHSSINMSSSSSSLDSSSGGSAYQYLSQAGSVDTASFALQSGASATEFVSASLAIMPAEQEEE